MDALKASRKYLLRMTSFARLQDVNFESLIQMPQQTHNFYTTLVLGHIYVTSYMNVYATLLQRM